MSKLIIYCGFGFVLQNCDLAQQSIVHIVQSSQNSQNKEKTEDSCIGGALKTLKREPESLTRIDLSTSILPSVSAGLAVILDPGKNSVSLSSEKSGNSVTYNISIYISKHVSFSFLGWIVLVPYHRGKPPKYMVYFIY